MKAWSSVVVVLAIAGCGGAPHVPDKLLESDAVRLDPEASARVTTARAELDRSRVALSGATDDVERARAEQKLAGADQTRADVELENAKKALGDAELRSKAAKGRSAYAAKLLEAREAAEGAARSRVEFAGAAYEHAKVVAVQQVNAEGAGGLRASDFAARVAETQRGVEKAESKARDLAEQAEKRRARWEELARAAPPAKM